MNEETKNTNNKKIENIDNRLTNCRKDVLELIPYLNKLSQEDINYIGRITLQMLCEA